jgi:hypothetical protein
MSLGSWCASRGLRLAQRDTAAGGPAKGGLCPSLLLCKKGTAMMKRVWVFLLFAALAPSVHAADGDSLVRFDGGIGVIPVSNVTVTEGTVTVSRNVVRGVNPAGQIWVIEALTADVRADGRFRVRGRGLLLGGGNNIGLSNNARVFATLICENAVTAPQFSTDSAGVPLAANGDFRIDDVLATVPVTCPSPVLLIRNAANGGWFAAGIPNFEDED